MIPLRALIQRNSFPMITLALIIVNACVFLYQELLPPQAADMFLAHYALVPDHVRLAAFVTSMFLHAGWMHIIGNMWFLWVFGSHIEDAIGSAKYLLFYLICGIAAAFVQFAVNVGSPIPTVGASGAIAGVMGAFLLLYPRARIDTLIFIIIFITRIELPAALMLVYWFVIQLVSGLSSFSRMGMAFEGQSVAWFAHVGGFLAGLALLTLFRGRKRLRPVNYYYR
jgi:membrane associated rhomboid family serine protease